MQEETKEDALSHYTKREKEAKEGRRNGKKNKNKEEQWRCELRGPGRCL